MAQDTVVVAQHVRTQTSKLEQASSPGSVPLIAQPTFENLVTTGLLPSGTLLSPVDPERTGTIAEVMEDGFIQVGEHLCETIDRAAKEDHAEAGSGWDYWQAHLDSEDDPVTLSDLRERALAT